MKEWMEVPLWLKEIRALFGSAHNIDIIFKFLSPSDTSS
jgi:hypothetical protein